MRTPTPLVDAYKLGPRPSRRLIVQLAIVVGIFIVAITVAAAYGQRTGAVDLLRVATSILALEGLVLGLLQWRAQRLEASLERYFDRLEVANKRRLDYFNALNELAARDVSPESVDELFVYYMFTEVDTLEYAMRKSRLGYIDRELAERALRTFRNRCERHPLFWVAARIVVPGAGYDDDLEQLVARILDATQKHPLQDAAELEAARRFYFATARLPRISPTTAAGADASSQLSPAGAPVGEFRREVTEVVLSDPVDSIDLRHK